MNDYLGAYLLDALEPDETRAVHAHLAGCRTCREEVDGLAETASLLALLTSHDVEELYALDPIAADPIVAGTAPPGRRRHRAALAAAAVAAVLTAGTTLGWIRALDGGAAPTPAGVVQVVDPTTHVHAAVTMTDRSGGTELHLSLAGAYPSGWCSLIAHSRDGLSDTAATWVADKHGAASVDGTTAIPASRLTELDVLTADGTLLVRIRLPHHSK